MLTNLVSQRQRILQGSFSSRFVLRNKNRAGGAQSAMACELQHVALVFERLYAGWQENKYHQ
jgi:hypothetical protein